MFFTSCVTVMASSLRNLSSILMELSRNSRTRIFIASLLFLALFSYFSATLAGDSPAGTPATLASRLLFSHSSIPSLSSITPFNTHFITVPGNATKLVALSVISPVVDMTHLEKDSSKPEDQDNNTTMMVQDMSSCNIFDGTWVLEDDSDPVYKPGSCPFVDDAFNCIKNGRPDSEYQRLRWRPNGCRIPRLNGKTMLEILRGKRLVFVGDSLNRNMWESLVCALRESLEDKNRVFEVSGRREYRTQGFYSFRFQDYNCSIEFFRSPFLVQESKFSSHTGARKETLQLDMMQKSSYAYLDADIIIFNTGHWWTHEKTSQGKNYYQVGNYVYQKLSVSKAYWKALHTWANWVDSNIKSSRTKVFFRGYSASHYKGGQWSSGGSCDGETLPIMNDVHLAPYPHMMNILESVLNKMKTPVFYLNITAMTDYRKDGHPSIYRQPAAENQGHLGMFQDCSHWCLPGVPDAWNELLYAALLISHHS